MVSNYTAHIVYITEFVCLYTLDIGLLIYIISI